MDQENKKLKEFHSYLVRDNYPDIPDYNTFATTLSDPSKAKIFYDAMLKDGYLAQSGESVPDFEAFSTTLGLKKKDNLPSLLPEKGALSEMFSGFFKKNIDENKESISKIEEGQFKTPDLSLETPEYSGYQKGFFVNSLGESMHRNFTEEYSKSVAEDRIAAIDKELAGLPKVKATDRPIVLPTAGPSIAEPLTTDREKELRLERDQLSTSLKSPSQLSYILGKAYNQSIIGITDAIINGRQRAPEEWLKKYDAGMMTDVAATALGFMLDGPVFSGLGSLGKVAATKAMQPIVKNVMKKNVEKFVKAGIEEKLAQKLALQGAQKLAYTIPSVASSGTALGGYGALTDALMQWSDPDKEFKDIDFGQSLSRGMKDFVLGTGVGTLGLATAAMTKAAQAIPSTAGRIGTQAALQTGGLGAESALFVGGGTLLEGKKLKDIETKDFLETVALLATLKLSHAAQKPAETAKNIYQSTKFDPNKPGEGQFYVDIAPWELDAISPSEKLDYKSAMEKLSKDDKALADVMKDEYMPALLKQKLLWGSRGVGMENVNLYADRAVRNGEYVDLYNKENVLVDRRKYSDKDFADQAAVEIGLQLEDNKMQMQSASLEVDRVKLLNDFKNKGGDVSKLLAALDKPVSERASEESKMVGDWFSMIPKPESKTGKASGKKPETKEEKPEQKLSLGDKTFTDKTELDKYLEEVAINKESGEVDERWFDREVNSWPNMETVKAINEWTENKKAEIKSKQAKAKPKKEAPEEPEITQKVQKELDKDGLIDEIRRYNILSASQKKKNALQANTIRVNAQRLGYELKEGMDEWKIGVTKDGKFLPLKKTPVKTDKAKIESQKLLSERDQEFQDYVNDVLETNPNLFGVMIGGLSNEQRAQAYNDIKSGKKTAASMQALNELDRMYKEHGGIDIWNAEGQKKVSVSRDEIRAEVEDMKRKKRDELFNVYDLNEALEKGLITKTEYDEIRESERKQDLESRAAEEDFYRDETGDVESNKQEGGVDEGGKQKVETDEGQVQKPDVAKGTETGDKLQTGTTPTEGGATKKGKTEPKYTAEQQSQIDSINKDYDSQIAEVQKSIESNKKAKDKAVNEAQMRKGLFGDIKDTGEAKMFSQEEQGFEVTPERIKAVEKPYNEIDVELSKKITQLEKERQSKIGEVEKQTAMKFEEAGVKFKDKTYLSVESVQDDVSSGKLTFEESKQLLEDVRKFEEKQKEDADKISKTLGEKLNAEADKNEKEMLDELESKKGELHAKFFPLGLVEQGSTQLWKALNPLVGKFEDGLASVLKKGIKSQNDILRWSAKTLSNYYGGLARTQKEMFGEKGRVGKLGLSGTVKAAAPHEASELLTQLRSLVSADYESLRRVRDVLDPEIAREKLVYGDLSVAEKNLYWALKTWNTWIWATNYKNGYIPTESHLKFKGDYDATGFSDYVARLYDKYEEPAEMTEIAARGKSGIPLKVVTDYMKMRSELDEWKKEHAIEDPAYLTAKRVMQTIQNQAIKEYQDLILKEHPEYVVKVKKGEAVPKGYTQLGSSYTWGQFRNKAVINHIVEDFTGFYYQNAITNSVYDAWKAVDRTKFNQFYKKFRTVLNPFVQTGNVTGNLFFASIAGINPVHFAAEMALNGNFHTKNPGLFHKLLRSGLIGDVALSSDMRPLIKPDGTLPFTAQPQPKTLKEKGKDVIKKIDEVTTGAYVGADNLAKISAYTIFRKQGLTHEQAVKRVYDSFQNYATVGKTWDFASKIPIFGPTFGKFQADLQRILFNAMTTTPLTTIGTVMLIKMLGNLTSALSGETEEEQAIRESRKGVAKIPFVDVPLSFKIGKSEVNVARYLSPLYLYTNDDSQMDLAEISKFLPVQLQKREPGKLLPKISNADATWGWVGALWSDRDFRNMSVVNPYSTKYIDPNVTEGEKIVNAIRFIARSQVPFYRTGEDFYNAATGQLDYYGRKRDLKQSILNNIVKIQEFDDPELKSYMERNIDYLTNRYAALSESMGDSNVLYQRAIKNAKDKGLSEDAIKRIQESEYKTLQKRLDKSLREQTELASEIDRLSSVYSKWHPDDPSVKENYENLESGKTRRFNVMDDMDLYKKYEDQYLLMKQNYMIDRPTKKELPENIYGKKITWTDELKKEYLKNYWSEYVKKLDSSIGLTEEEIAKAKKNEKSYHNDIVYAKQSARNYAERQTYKYLKESNVNK